MFNKNKLTNTNQDYEMINQWLSQDITHIITDIDADGLISYTLLKLVYPHLELAGFYDTSSLRIKNKQCYQVLHNKPQQVLGIDTDLLTINTIDHHLYTKSYATASNNSPFVHFNPNNLINDQYDIFKKCPYNSAQVMNIYFDLYHKLVTKYPQSKKLIYHLMRYSDGSYSNEIIYKKNYSNYDKFFSNYFTNMKCGFKEVDPKILYCIKNLLNFKLKEDLKEQLNKEKLYQNLNNKLKSDLKTKINRIKDNNVINVIKDESGKTIKEYDQKQMELEIEKILQIFGDKDNVLPQKIDFNNIIETPDLQDDFLNDFIKVFNDGIKLYNKCELVNKFDVVYSATVSEKTISFANTNSNIFKQTIVQDPSLGWLFGTKELINDQYQKTKSTADELII